MIAPKHPSRSIVAARLLVSHLLTRGKLDPFSETFALVALAAALLFNEDENELREKFGRIPLSDDELKAESALLDRKVSEMQGGNA